MGSKSIGFVAVIGLIVFLTVYLGYDRWAQGATQHAYAKHMEQLDKRFEVQQPNEAQAQQRALENIAQEPNAVPEDPKTQEQARAEQKQDSAFGQKWNKFEDNFENHKKAFENF